MAIKTITIDMQAHEILSRHEAAGQSFSDVIEERPGKEMTGKDLRAPSARTELSDETLDARDARVKARRRHRARPPKP